MKGIIGRKLGMTQVFDGPAMVPVTVIEAGPCPVLALRTQEKHGYSAVQLGFGRRKVKNVSKAVLGHLQAAAQQDTPPAVCREIRLAGDPEVSVGDSLGAGLFAVGEFVDVVGTTKGRGFSGVIRRHHFGGGRATHGGAWTRRTGSIGMNVNPARVYKGRKMPGQHGNARRTVQNLRIVAVRPEENLLLVRGAVPGATGGVLLVCSAVKK